MLEELNQLFRFRKGHFLLESGHHGDLWLDLDLLCQHPQSLQPFVCELTQCLTQYELHAVCGPLVEGAFIGLLVAKELGVDFFYTEQVAQPVSADFFPVRYRLPQGQQTRIAGKRVAIVNDVINAGSAVRGTYNDLTSRNANVVVMATLLTLGDTPSLLANQWNVDLITLASQSNSIWEPEECPLCANLIPLDNA